MDGSILNGEKMSSPTQAAAETVAPEVRRITAKEYLALAKTDRPKILREKTVNVPLNDEVEMGITVRQLTKKQIDLLNGRVLGAMPVVPTVSQTYSTIHTDPITGKARRPGTYQEQNADDPKYKQSIEVWFNNACVWMALLSAAEDLGVTTENIEERFNEIEDELPGPALLRVAIEAAQMNEGLNLADQLMNQIRSNDAIMEQVAEFEALQEEAERLRAAAPVATPAEAKAE